MKKKGVAEKEKATVDIYSHPSFKGGAAKKSMQQRKTGKDSSKEEAGGSCAVQVPRKLSRKEKK